MKNKAIVKVMQPHGPSIASRMKDVLEMLGEDSSREGLLRTPERYEKAMRYLTSGYSQDAEKILNHAVFSVCYDEMVVLRNVPFESHCEHHLAPIIGRAWVAYVPDRRVVGISKLARVVDAFAQHLDVRDDD